MERHMVAKRWSPIRLPQSCSICSMISRPVLIARHPDGVRPTSLARRSDGSGWRCTYPSDSRSSTSSAMLDNDRLLERRSGGRSSDPILSPGARYRSLLRDAVRVRADRPVGPQRDAKATGADRDGARVRRRDPPDQPAMAAAPDHRKTSGPNRACTRPPRQAPSPGLTEPTRRSGHSRRLAEDVCDWCDQRRRPGSG
jgi:hypothetical protein